MRRCANAQPDASASVHGRQEARPVGAGMRAVGRWPWDSGRISAAGALIRPFSEREKGVGAKLVARHASWLARLMLRRVSGTIALADQPVVAAAVREASCRRNLRSKARRVDLSPEPVESRACAPMSIGISGAPSKYDPVDTLHRNGLAGSCEFRNLSVRTAFGGGRRPTRGRKVNGRNA
jgi:hypothetical protein